jgi:hypothetical protein
MKKAIDMTSIMRRGEDTRVDRVRSEIEPEQADMPSPYGDLRPPARVPTVAMSIRLPVDMHETLKVRAFRTGISIQQMISAAVARAIADDFR